MDDLPKNAPDDFSAYSGTYPTDPPIPPAPPADTTVSGTASGATSAPSFVTEPAEPYSSPPLTSPPGAANYSPANPVSDPFASVVSAPPAAGTPPAPGGDAANPFTYQADAPQTTGSSGGSGIKRVLAIILLLLALGLVGFLGFTFIGKFLSQSQPVVLNYWGLWENEQVVKPLIDEYQNTHPKVKIIYTKNSIKQYRERVQNYIGRGDGPDLFRFHATWVPMLKNELAAAGKTGYTAAEFKTTFYQLANNDLVVGGQVYGVPLMFDGLALYYNEDLLRAAGITPPVSWEDFRTAALALTVKDSAGKIVTAGAALGTTSNVEHFSDILALMMLQNGVNLNKPTGPEAQQALSFYRLFAEPPNNVWDASMENSIEAFANRRVAFLFAPSWQVFTIRDTNPQLKFQIIPVPQLVGTNVTWGSYWAEGVSSKSKHPDEAWDFLKFLSRKESMVKLYSEEAKIRVFGEPYSRVDLASTLDKDPFVGAYLQEAPTAQSFPLSGRTFDAGINDGMIKYLEDAVNSQGSGVSAEAALATMAQGFAQVLGRYSGK